MWAGGKWRLWRSEAIYIEKIIMITLRQVLKIMAICKAKDRCHFHLSWYAITLSPKKMF